MKVASIEEYRHLLFTGEVPTGFKLEEDVSDGEYMWVIRKGDILDQVYRMYSGDGFWVALLDTGHLCFASNGYGYTLYGNTFPMEGYCAFIGKGRCHYKVVKVRQ